MKSKVAVKGCSTYDTDVIYQKLSESIDLLGHISSFIKKRDKVLIKPNMITGMDPDKGVNTHPAVVEAVVKMVLDAGGIPIIGDSPQLETATQVSKIVGYDKIAKKYNIEIVDFVHPVSSFFNEGVVFKRFDVDKHILECDKIINVAKLKTHGQMVITFTVKNMYGSMVGGEKIKGHLVAGESYELFAKRLLELYHFTKPCLNILDGIIGMEGHGPVTGSTREIGVLLVGTDGVAVDRVACEIVGIEPKSVPIFKANKELNVGNDDLENIEVMGDDINKFKIKDFKISTLDKMNDFMMIPQFIKNIIKNKMVKYPVVMKEKCKKCGLCAKVCPMQTIKITNSGAVINHKKCIRCYCCMEACKYGVIKIKTPLLASLMSDKLIKSLNNVKNFILRKNV